MLTLQVSHKLPVKFSTVGRNLIICILSAAKKMQLEKRTAIFLNVTKVLQRQICLGCSGQE
jgi:hypothetical protein